MGTPSNLISPETSVCDVSMSPMIDMAVSDLPLPDSPTMPIILFFGTDNSISDNANCGIGRVKRTLSLMIDNKDVNSSLTRMDYFKMCSNSSIFMTSFMGFMNSLLW